MCLAQLMAHHDVSGNVAADSYHDCTRVCGLAPAEDQGGALSDTEDNGALSTTSCTTSHWCLVEASLSALELFGLNDLIGCFNICIGLDSIGTLFDRCRIEFHCSGFACTELIGLLDAFDKSAQGVVRQLLEVWARVQAIEDRFHLPATAIYFITSLTADTTTAMAGEFGGVQATFEVATHKAWQDDGCPQLHPSEPMYKLVTYKQCEDHVCNLVRAFVNQKIVKYFQGHDGYEWLVFERKCGSPLSLHLQVIRRVSKQLLTFKHSQFASSQDEQDKQEGKLAVHFKLQRPSFNRFCTYGACASFINHYMECVCIVLPQEEDLLQDPHIEALFQLEELCSSHFELPFLKGSHSFGVVHSSIYGAWCNGYMQMICRWQLHPKEFDPAFWRLPLWQQEWTNMYIFAIHQVVTKVLLIRAPTMLNPSNLFGENMFRYTRAVLQGNQRTRALLMEAYIRLWLTYYCDELLDHCILHEKVLRKQAQMVFRDPANSYRAYCDARAQQLLRQQEVQLAKDCVAETDAFALETMKQLHLCAAESSSLTGALLRGALKQVKGSSDRFHAIKISENRPSILQQWEAVAPLYASGDESAIYKP